MSLYYSPIIKGQTENGFKFQMQVVSHKSRTTLQRLSRPRFWNKIRMTECAVLKITYAVILTMFLVRIPAPRGVSEASSHCHPELVSGSGFDPLGGRWTVDWQPCLHSVQRLSKPRCWNKFTMTGWVVFRNNKHPEAGMIFQRSPLLSSRTCFGIFVLILSENGGPLTHNLAFSSGQRMLEFLHSACSEQRFLGTRSRTGAIRDDKVSGFRGRF